MLAARSGNLVLLGALLDHGARMESVDGSRNNVMHVAYASGDDVLIQYLLSRGGSKLLHARNINGKQPARVAGSRLKLGRAVDGMGVSWKKREQRAAAARATRMAADAKRLLKQSALPLGMQPGQRDELLREQRDRRIHGLPVRPVSRGVARAAIGTRLPRRPATRGGGEIFGRRVAKPQRQRPFNEWDRMKGRDDPPKTDVSEQKRYHLKDGRVRWRRTKATRRHRQDHVGVPNVTADRSGRAHRAETSRWAQVVMVGLVAEGTHTGHTGRIVRGGGCGFGGAGDRASPCLFFRSSNASS